MTRHQLSRGPSRAVLALAVALLSIPLVHAQTHQPPVRFDMKPAGTEPLPGAVLVTEASLVGGGKDYGFGTAPIAAVVGNHPADDVVDPADDDRPLLRGCVRVASGTEFRCKIPANTKVRVRVLLASVPFYYAPGTTHYVFEPSAMSGLSVWAQKGSALGKVAENVDLRTAYLKGDLTTGIGSYRKLWFTAKSDAQGVLRIRFDRAGGGYVPVSAVEVHPFVALPITYKRQGASWLTPAAGVSAPGLAEFHAKDFAAAKTKFMQIADPLVRATALLWLHGWLDGSEDGDLGALNAAEGALATPSLLANARAIELRDLVADYRRAELHASLLNFSKSHALPPEGYGFFNPAKPQTVFAVLPTTASNAQRHLYLAENLYTQVAGRSLSPIVAWNQNAAADADFEVSPLAFRALDRIARLHFANNTKHSYWNGTTPKPGLKDGIDVAESIWKTFESGGFRAGEFGADATLAMCAWMSQDANHQHDKNGGLVTFWNGQDVPLSWYDPAKAWWKDHVIAPGSAPAGTPEWAEAQRRYVKAFRGAVRWWVERRFEGGEFGGGPGDDPELAALLLAPTLAMRQPDDGAIVEALRASAEHVLEGGFVGAGYYGGVPIDVEHSAEFTSYPLLVGLSLFPGDPYYLQKALDAVRLLAAPPAGASPWAKQDPGGNLRFHSFWFNDQGPAPAGSIQSDYFVDLPLNAKAMLPAFQVLARGTNATLEGHLVSWIDGWRDEAMKSSPTRPRGLLPASVNANTLAQGYNGQWWKATSDEPFYDFPANLYHHTFLQSGFFGLAHSLGGSQAYTYLTPMVQLLRELLALDAKVKAGQTPSDVNTTGTKNWALNRLLTSGLFMNDAALLLHALEAEPLLQTLDDPYQPGTAPYVDQAFLADARKLIKERSGDYISYLAEKHTGPNPSAGVYVRKGKTQIVSALDAGGRWLRNFFPLATTLVSYTDRAYLFFGNSFGVMFGSLTGGQLGGGSPSHVVTWETVGGETKPLDLAVLVNDLSVDEGTTQDRLRVLLWNFESTPRAVGFRLWHRLRSGRYHVRIGPAHVNTDYFDGAFTSSTMDFDRRGELGLVMVPSQTLTLLELERFADLPEPAGYDIALGADATPLAWQGPNVVRMRAKVASTGAAATPAGAVKAYAGVLDPAGNLLALDAAGTKEVELPLAQNVPSLPGVASYALPATQAALDLPMVPLVWTLLLADLKVRIRFQQHAGADFDSTNDQTVVTLGLAELLAL